MGRASSRAGSSAASSHHHRDVAPGRSLIRWRCRFYKDSSPTDFAAFASIARQKSNRPAVVGRATPCALSGRTSSVHWQGWPSAKTGSQRTDRPTILPQRGLKPAGARFFFASATFRSSGAAFFSTGARFRLAGAAIFPASAAYLFAGARRNLAGALFLLIPQGFYYPGACSNDPWICSDDPWDCSNDRWMCSDDRWNGFFHRCERFFSPVRRFFQKCAENMICAEKRSGRAPKIPAWAPKRCSPHACSRSGRRKDAPCAENISLGVVQTSQCGGNVQKCGENVLRAGKRLTGARSGQSVGPRTSKKVLAR